MYINQSCLNNTNGYLFLDHPYMTGHRKPTCKCKQLDNEI